MADTLLNGLVVPILQSEPPTPSEGHIIYAIGLSVFAKFSDGSVKELTDG